MSATKTINVNRFTNTMTLTVFV